MSKFFANNADYVEALRRSNPAPDPAVQIAQAAAATAGLDGEAYAAFVARISRMTPYPEDGNDYSEDAVETLSRLIEQAKALMGDPTEAAK